MRFEFQVSRLKNFDSLAFSFYFFTFHLPIFCSGEGPVIARTKKGGRPRLCFSLIGRQFQV